jgi:hypothetical protein
MYAQLHQHSRGVSFVELLIAAAVITLVFGGLAATFQTMVKLIGSTKAEAGALSLANERLEYIRSLPYDSIGTVGGIPNGTIPQVATTTLNGILYTERVLIQYVDAPDDGIGVDDYNGILADYKMVKIEFIWDGLDGTDSLSLISNIVPRGIETTAGGGTLTVNVFDASVQPVPDAEVRLFNDTTTSTIDILRYTNENGVAMFAGAPAATNYQINVSKSGYSSEQTHSSTATNTNPTTQHVSVLESEVSTMNFQIDLTSDLVVKTIGVPTIGVFNDTFSNGNLVASSSDVTITGGAAILAGVAGSYEPVGTLFSTSTRPASFTNWEAATFVADTSASTSVSVQIYEVSGGSYMLVPDSDLPGNSTGFISPVIDLSSLDDSSYPELALGATLTSLDINETPELLEWELSYIINEPSIGNVDFVLTGNKTIGTDGGGSPVYKYQEEHTTDAGGDVIVAGLEWDMYDVVLSDGIYDIAQACENIPYILEPGVVEILTLTLLPPVASSLRVMVEDTSGNAVPGADVQLTRSGFNESEITSVCGQTFFNSGVSEQTDYQLDVSAAGYVSEVMTDVTVNGATSITVTLNN